MNRFQDLDLDDKVVSEIEKDVQASSRFDLDLDDEDSEAFQAHLRALKKAKKLDKWAAAILFDVRRHNGTLKFSNESGSSVMLAVFTDRRSNRRLIRARLEDHDVIVWVTIAEVDKEGTIEPVMPAEHVHSEMKLLISMVQNHERVDGIRVEATLCCTVCNKRLSKQDDINKGVHIGLCG